MTMVKRSASSGAGRITPVPEAAEVINVTVEVSAVAVPWFVPAAVTVSETVVFNALKLLSTSVKVSSLPFVLRRVSVGMAYNWKMPEALNAMPMSPPFGVTGMFVIPVSK